MIAAHLRLDVTPTRPTYKLRLQEVVGSRPIAGLSRRLLDSGCGHSAGGKLARHVVS